MPPDTEVIETRLTMLVEHLNDLKAVQTTTFDEYQRNKTTISSFITAT